MRDVGGKIVLSPSDLSNFLHCRHRTGLDLAVARGALARPERVEPYAAFLQQLGDAHEQRYVASLRAGGLSVIDLSDLKDDPDAHELTTRAMRDGAEVIVQARVKRDDLAGYADVLRRVGRPSGLAIRARTTCSSPGSVELPFGDGKRWLANSRFGRAMLGGWQVSGIYHLQSGRFIDWGNRFYYGDNYEDIVLPRGERERARWFNTDNFERASARQPASFHTRVFPRRLDFAKGDYMNQLDMALSRSVGLWGSSRFQVTLSAINVLNNVQWDQPNTDPTNSNFGVVTQQWNTPRWLQLQGRFTF